MQKKGQGANMNMLMKGQGGPAGQQPSQQQIQNFIN